MRDTIRLGLASVMLVFVGTAHAAFIQYQVTDQGDGSWRYDYLVGQEDGAASVEEFTIFFDLTLYSDLSLIGTPTDWDGLLVQPDLELPDDGFADWLALSVGIGPGSSLGGFSVLFDWLGQGTPGEQVFDIIDALSFLSLQSGTTQLWVVEPPPSGVPEPGTLALFGLGLAGLGFARRRKQA